MSLHVFSTTTTKTIAPYKKTTAAGSNANKCQRSPHNMRSVWGELAGVCFQFEGLPRACVCTFVSVDWQRTIITIWIHRCVCVRSIFGSQKHSTYIDEQDQKTHWKSDVCVEIEQQYPPLVDDQLHASWLFGSHKLWNWCIRRSCTISVGGDDIRSALEIFIVCGRCDPSTAWI